MKAEPTRVETLPIEIGMVIAGKLDLVDRQALDDAIAATGSALTQSHQSAGLTFHFVKVQRRDLVSESRIEPSVLLRQAQEERDARGWDFAFVVTASELLGKYSATSCFAALSRPLDAAVISTSLIDPDTNGLTLAVAMTDALPPLSSQKVSSATDSRTIDGLTDTTPSLTESIASDISVNVSQRQSTLADRLTRLMLHAVGHLCGLPQVDAEDRIMSRPRSTESLDRPSRFDENELAKLQRALLEMADQRLEENASQPGNNVSFLVNAAWINRQEIAEAVYAARPWQFPRRLSGLTIGSVSTVMILLMTAEAWDLALTQNSVSVMTLGFVVAIATTVFVAVRQQLLIRRRHTRSEQNVVTAASAVLIVAAGMMTTWLCLAAVGMLAANLLFSSELIVSWASLSELDPHEVGVASRWLMVCFCSSIGILIGALGASFESQHYFQHVIFVDEEL